MKRLDEVEWVGRTNFFYVSHEKYSKNYLTVIHSMTVEGGHTNKTKTE